MNLVKRLCLVLLLSAVVLGYSLLLWRGPWWIDGSHLRTEGLQPADGVVITGFRTTLVALGAGLIAAIGLYYTHRTLQHTREKDREQAEIEREGQVTDRYVEAIKLLSSDSLTERLGGIYALQRIMQDSVKDHVTIMSVLSAYIRTYRSVLDDRPADSANASRAPSSAHLPEDVKAALSVIAKRPERNLSDEWVDLRSMDFRGADLREADLRAADLREAKFEGTSLRGAVLRGANLRGANLRFADLKGADLRSADLRGADLHVADLESADLRKANLGSAVLRGANFLYTNLGDADLQRADLREADLAVSGKTENGHLEPTQVAKAHIYRSTRLPTPVAAQAVVLNRIEACEAGPR
ncbi:pentapeptide repeat-containing protein [Streptomyces sp. 2323.1]|uniref:pentapeptide repeat-containing protein n=1 Tax=Streptomyces sp. 2323.1 TaxID=1938841 RepID=UPI0013313DB2|nr:pentapeptide repeat-containing protein [Streptomyces sp. 2323.1]